MRDYDTTPHNITAHFTMDEVSITQHRDIDNTLPAELYPSAVHTAQQLEKVRELLEAPIIVNSWFRCHALNFKVGSKSTSAHPKAEAVDFTVPRLSSLQVCKAIIAAGPHIDFDQLILEHTWVHIAFNYDPTKRNRNQVLSLLDNGAYSIGLTNRKGVAYK